MRRGLLVFIFLTQLFLLDIYAKKLKLSLLDEIKILKSLDIDKSYMSDPKYIEMKNNIDDLMVIYFLKTLKVGNIFMPNLHQLIEEADIPDTFLYMAMVESRFLADVKSHKNAAGLWQLMPLTAKKFDLEISRDIDERLDPIKSSEAAVKYIRYLYDRFGKWYLVAIAYNCGETKLARVIKRVKSDDLAVLINDKNAYLPKETRDYIRRIIIAALLAYDDEIIVKNDANHLFGNSKSPKLVKAFFKGGKSLKSISKDVGISLDKIKSCNPHLLHSKLPVNKKSYYVYLPQNYLKNYKSIAQKGDITDRRLDSKIKITMLDTKKSSNNDEIFTYLVKKGDTPFSISIKFNNTIATLSKLNPDFIKNLKPGRVIRVKR